jgi:hypothetical protein
MYEQIDIEAAVVAFLAEDPDLEEIHDGRVSTEVPENPVFPRLRITRIGGLMDPDAWIDRPRIAVEAWANDKATAWALIAKTTAVLQTRLVAAPIEAGVITSVRQDQGATWAPDPETGKPRYTVSVQITTHPTP